VLPQDPTRDSSDYTEDRVRHVDHSCRIAEKPPGARGDALRS